MFSGKRGGFGAYLPLMQLIEKDIDLELQIILGDMHTSDEFGETAQEVKIYFPGALIKSIIMGTGRGDSCRVRVENLGLFLQQVGAALEELKPDILMVHGDRAEHLVMATATVHFNIVVAHTQGGETSGNVDDTLRHAITKLAHIHFPETEKSALKIAALGEESWRIHAVGSLYIDRIFKKMYTLPEEVKTKYGLSAGDDYAIVMYHSDTYETAEANYLAMQWLLSAVGLLSVRSVIVYPCSDPGYKAVIRAILEIKDNHPQQYLVYKNIDNLDFLGLMAGAKAMIGNSSSAFVEAPYFKLPAVNIGNRQRGRDREENVIDCRTNFTDINAAIGKALSSDFASSISNCGYRLGFGNASEKILEIIKSVNIDERLLRKS